MIGIVGFGGYVPRLRMSRQAIVEANTWYAPQFRAKARGTRSLANWDEDSITMAVAAARDCLGTDEDRAHVGTVYLASGSLPFAERLNAGIVVEALTLEGDVAALDLTGSQRAGLSALGEALSKASADERDILVLAADNRVTRAASAAELDGGDGAAALLVGRGRVLAEYVGGAVHAVDFVDRFRLEGEDVDYQWEERWVRDEGITKLVPPVIDDALRRAGIEADQVDHFIFPTTFQKMDAQLAKRCGIRAEAIVDNLAAQVGDTGVAHGLLLLSHVLAGAKPGQVILLAQFGSGAQALVFRVTEHIAAHRPRVGVAGWLARGCEERSYSKMLSFKGVLPMERGMRGEQDKKTALTTLYRHRRAILGLVAGRCSVTGDVHFPPSRISYTQGAPVLDSQQPHKLAERRGTVLSWSAEFLSYYPAPPQHYGQIDFDGGGRILMEFTDLAQGEIESGSAMEMVFRIKDIDEKRGFVRYFWKATPVRESAAASEKAHG